MYELCVVCVQSGQSKNADLSEKRAFYGKTVFWVFISIGIFRHPPSHITGGSNGASSRNFHDEHGHEETKEICSAFFFQCEEQCS